MLVGERLVAQRSGGIPDMPIRIVVVIRLSTLKAARCLEKVNPRLAYAL
jgi:hypothetical protein